jgi:hypothetical protein
MKQFGLPNETGDKKADDCNSFGIEERKREESKEGLSPSLDLRNFWANEHEATRRRNRLSYLMVALHGNGNRIRSLSCLEAILGSTKRHHRRWKHCSCFAGRLSSYLGLGRHCRSL